MQKIMSLFQNHASRPENVFEDPFSVFDLTKWESNKIKVIQHEENLLFCRSFIYTQQSFEVMFVRFNEPPYSIFRSFDQGTAEDVYNKVKQPLNSVAKGISNRKPRQMAFILKQLTTSSFHYPEWTSAHLAAQMGLINMFTTDYPEVIENINNHKPPKFKTPLHVAIETQNIQTVRAILALKPNLELIDYRKNTVLHLASMTNREIFLTIFKHDQGSKLITYRNRDECTPFYLACFADKPDIVKEYFKIGLTMDQMIVSVPKDIKNEDEELIPLKKDQSYEGAKLEPKKAEAPETTNSKKLIFPNDIIYDLDEEDIKLGGCPLHWAKTRRTMDKLLDMGFPMNVRNLMDETALHVMIRRSRLKNSLGLLNYGASCVVEAYGGETPLHYAVKKSDISAVQALLVFDCDMNKLNLLGHSARHAASVNRNTFNDVILYVLNSVGALRCNNKVTGCADGCACDGRFSGTAYSKWPTYEEETLYKKFLLESVIQEARMKKRSKKDSDITYANVLCLDGGGVKGLITAQILIELQKKLKGPIDQYFSWISGTSTGSFIATLLCLKYTPIEIRKIYLSFKDKILQGTKPYNSVNFEKTLKSYVNENFTMSQIKPVKLIITATLADRNPAQLHLFRSYRSPAELLGLKRKTIKELKPLPNCDNQLVWSACRASGSAPVFFRAHGPFIDGGIIANNPTLDTLTEFTLYNEALSLCSRNTEMEKLKLVLSIGTGKVPLSARTPVDIGKIMLFHPSESFKSAMCARDLILMLTEQVTNTDAHVVDRAQAWCKTMSIPYFRVNPPLSEDIPVDSVDDVELINALWETKAYMFSMKNQIDILIELLKTDFEEESTENKKQTDTLENNEGPPGPPSPSDMTMKVTETDINRDFGQNFKLQDTEIKK